MSVNWNALPVEIWLLIFDHVKDTKQLVQCRLVCKTWDPLAERAMFGQPLFFNSNYIVTGIYHHLVKKPVLGQCIKEIHFTGPDIASLPFPRELLELVFTPSIISVISVEGFISDATYEIMLDIAQSSAVQFKKLAYLSLPTSFDKPIHMELVLFFRKSLKELVFWMGLDDEPSRSEELKRLQPLLGRLNEFNSLTSLSMDFYGTVDCLTTFEDILKNCNNLLKLNINVGDFRRNAWLGREEMQNWMVSNVTKCPNPCELYIRFMKNPQIVEYLLYKYPNATKVDLNGLILEDKEEEVIQRCTSAVGKLKNVSTHFTTAHSDIDQSPFHLSDLEPFDYFDDYGYDQDDYY